MRSVTRIFKKILPILHPFFFSLYPVLNLYAVNLGQVTFSQVQRSLLFFLGLAALLLAVLRLLLKDWERAGVAASLLLLMVFTFGQLQLSLRGLFSSQAWGWLWKGTLFAFWLALFSLVGWLLIFRLRRVRDVSRIFNLVGGFLILIVGGQIAFGLNRTPPVVAAAHVETPAAQDLLPQATPSGAKPDIYYIILDDYGQGQMLKDLYGLDNSAFLDGLRARGFTIAEDSHSNYNQTILSLASTLNLDYLDRLVALHPEQNDRQALVERVKSNTAMRFLKEHGYQTIVIASGYEFTEIDGADVFLAPRVQINSFESMLISSAFAEVGLKQAMQTSYRMEVLQRFSILESMASRPGPKFVFAHIVLPHPPFVFDRQGGPREPKILGFSDGSHLGLPPAEYIDAYNEQLLYANRLVNSLVDSILKNSATEPVIILQGDHGPGARLDWTSLEASCIRERLSILNAYYLPGGKTMQEVGLYPSITPVNSFRLIFDAYLDTQLGGLEDRSYFPIWDRPQDLIDVTRRLNTCAPLEK